MNYEGGMSKETSRKQCEPFRDGARLDQEWADAIDGTF